MWRNSYRINLSQTLNRSYCITAYPENQPLHFSVLFNKKSSGMEFQYDTRNDMISSKTISVKLFRNLMNNCIFSKIFFVLEDDKNDRYDYRSEFKCLNQQFSSNIVRFFYERIDLRYNEDDEYNDESNNLYISGWKIVDIDTDLLFYLVQRKFYNVSTRLNIIRSMGIQFSNDRGNKVLDDYYDRYCNDIFNA